MYPDSQNRKVIMIRGHSKKVFRKLGLLERWGFFALRSGGKNMNTYSARKKLHFFANFAVIFLEKKFQI